MGNIDFDIMINDSYLQGIFIHEIFAYMFFIPYLWYLFLLFNHKTYKVMNHKIYFVVPITIFLISVALATGIFLLAMRGFVFDIRIVLMIVVSLIFIAGEIYRIKILKKAKTSKENMQNYVRTCKIMYISFLIIYAFLLWFCKN